MRLVASKWRGKIYLIPHDTEILKAIKKVAPQHYDTAIENYLKKVKKNG